MLRNPTVAQPIPAGDAVDSMPMLVARSRAGDSAAFALLYRQFVNQVYAYSVRRLSTREAAEEATQETFTRALAGLNRCRNDAAFAGWLFGIAHHVVNEQYRAAGLQTSSLDGNLDPADPEIGPEDRAICNEDAAELRRARERCLTEKERTLFDLLLAGLTDAQIAVVLGKRSGAIRTAHWRLLIKLRGCLSMLTRLMGGRHAPA
jgi:RNA polymerase sigma-70 factor, ECF subfamily